MPAHRQRSRRARPAGIDDRLAMSAGTGLLARNAPAGTAPATATVSDGKVHHPAADGQTDDVTVEWAGYDSSADTDTYSIDDIVEITAGTDCAHPNSGDLTYVTRTAPDAGDGTDALYGNHGNHVLHGGSGASILHKV
ncbi:hypothetical protein ACFXJ5_06695 [Streptomyces sp. NPDC059373]